MRSHIIIPARLESVRLPRKLLLRETGKPLIQHTYETAQTAQRPAGICVAADHDDIAAAIRTFGGNAIMTDPKLRTGTDRVAEVVRNMPELDIAVNVQGDEPEISGADVDQVVALLEQNPRAVMATLAAPLRDRARLEDASSVKVVFDEQGRALYFSRSVIPHPWSWNDLLLAADPPNFYQHIGLYAYRRDFLLQLAEMPQSRLEQMESLEQLRALIAGATIQVGVIDRPHYSINTSADYHAFVERTRSTT